MPASDGRLVADRRRLFRISRCGKVGASETPRPTRTPAPSAVPNVRIHLPPPASRANFHIGGLTSKWDSNYRSLCDRVAFFPWGRSAPAVGFLVGPTLCASRRSLWRVLEERPYSKRDHEFESAFLHRGVQCEPDFCRRIPSIPVGNSASPDLLGAAWARLAKLKEAEPKAIFAIWPRQCAAIG